MSTIDRSILTLGENIEILGFAKKQQEELVFDLAIKFIKAHTENDMISPIVPPKGHNKDPLAGFWFPVNLTDNQNMFLGQELRGLPDSKACKYVRDRLRHYLKDPNIIANSISKVSIELVTVTCFDTPNGKTAPEYGLDMSKFNAKRIFMAHYNAG